MRQRVAVIHLADLVGFATKTTLPSAVETVIAKVCLLRRSFPDAAWTNAAWPITDTTWPAGATTNAATNAKAIATSTTSTATS
jgi:hypothetical protein